MLAGEPFVGEGSGLASASAGGPRRLSLRLRLVALVLAAVAPVLLFSTLMLHRLGAAESAAVEAGLRQTARAMSLAVDREIGAAQAVLDVLGASPALAGGDLATFHREASAAAAARGTPIALVDREGRQVINTMRPFEPAAEPARAVLPGLFEMISSTGRFGVSDVFKGTLTGEPRVVAAVPVRDASGAVTRILGKIVPSPRLSALLAEQGLRPGWIGVVLDRQGIIVARTRDAERFVGRPGGALLRERVLAGDVSGLVENVTADGQEVVSVYARSPVTGWTVSVGMPRTEAGAALRQTLVLLAAAGATLLGLAVLLATLVGRGIAGPVAALAASARAVGGGQPMPAPVAAIPELEEVDRSLRGAGATIRSREAELRAQTVRAERLAAERAAVLGQLAEGVVVADADGRVTYLNEAAARLHGCARIGATPEDYAEAHRPLAEDGRPLTADDLPLARAARGGETVLDLRWRMRRPDGSEVLAIGSASPLLDGEGTIVGAVLTVRDDTARDEAERLLREREGELARVQRIGAVGGLEVDLRGQAFRNKRSPEYLRIHGLPEDASRETHESWVARIHPDDRERTVTGFTSAVAGTGRDYEAEYRIIRPSDGAERWIHAKAEIERDAAGAPLRLVGAHIDITKRKRAELAFEARTRELESVLATVPVGVWFTYDPQVGEIRRNRAASRLMRLDPDAPASGLPDDVRILRDGRAAPLAELPLQRAMRGESATDEEFTLAFADGSERHLLWSATALRDERGAVVGAVAAALDITERKRAERHQRLLIHELNHRVKNTLATVQSIAAQSLRGSPSAGPVREAFEARLMALSRAHDVLTRESWEGASLREIVEGAVSPFRGPGEARFRLVGPDLRVAPRTALALAMSLHELGTNAVKYGALSGPEGEVAVEWSIEDGGSLRLSWRETGGPPVAPPTRRGFGTRLVERQLAAEFGGAVSLEFRPEGVVCAIEAPLEPAGP